jgi:hypothetical protein
MDLLSCNEFPARRATQGEILQGDQSGLSQSLRTISIQGGAMTYGWGSAFALEAFWVVPHTPQALTWPLPSSCQGSPNNPCHVPSVLDLGSIHTGNLLHTEGRLLGGTWTSYIRIAEVQAGRLRGVDDMHGSLNVDPSIPLATRQMWCRLIESKTPVAKWAWGSTCFWSPNFHIFYPPFLMWAMWMLWWSRSVRTQFGIKGICSY